MENVILRGIPRVGKTTLLAEFLNTQHRDTPKLVYSSNFDIFRMLINKGITGGIFAVECFNHVKGIVGKLKNKNFILVIDNLHTSHTDIVRFVKFVQAEYGGTFSMLATCSALHERSESTDVDERVIEKLKDLGFTKLINIERAENPFTDECKLTDYYTKVPYCMFGTEETNIKIVTLIDKYHSVTLGDL